MSASENYRPPEDEAESILDFEAEGLFNFLHGNYATSHAADQAEVILEAMEQVAKDHTLPALAQIDILGICRDALENRIKDRLVAHGFDIRHLEGWPEKSQVEDYRGDDEAVQTQLNALRKLVAVIKKMQSSISDFKDD
jgi:hypothetical protein